MQDRFQQKWAEQDRVATLKRAQAINIAVENKRLAETRKLQQQTSQVQDCIVQADAVRRNKYEI